jgi:hypothetical protein
MFALLNHKLKILSFLKRKRDRALPLITGNKYLEKKRRLKRVGNAFLRLNAV